ncbi:MAG: energy-coupled thiamine transporter ThiT [Clostridia bacterium]|nr:energy-coupled thiamine transporter ThiT [Clostridia bacterium]
MWDFLRTEYVYNDTTYEEYYSVDLGRLTDLVSSFMLYVTIALLIALAVAFVVVKLKKTDSLPAFLKFTTAITVGYSVSVIAVLGYLNIVESVIDEKINTNFWLIIALLIFAVLSTVVSTILKLKNSKAFKPVALVCTGLSLAYMIVILFVIPAKKAKYEPLSIYGMYVISALIVAVVVALAFLLDRKEKTGGTKSIAYAGICIALSFALSYVKFFTLGAQGGSVTFASLLPLMIFAYKFGAKKGLLAGVIYGLLQFIQSPQFYQTMQVLLDYPIAFGAIGLAGIFRDTDALKNDLIKFVLGATVAVTFRYAAHVVSGYYVFSSWAWEGYGALAYSLVYNLFCFVDLAIVLVPAVVIFSNKAVVNKLINQ